MDKSNKYFDYWTEATAIRNSNILALVALGFDSVMVVKDVHIYEENSVLFTKLSQLNNYDFYIKDWKHSFNSEDFKFSANKSDQIVVNSKKTHLVLKFYPSKGGYNGAYAIGLNKKGFIPHSFEASMEIFEMIVKKVSGNKNPNSDPIYDMHLKNSNKLLNTHNH